MRGPAAARRPSRAQRAAWPVVALLIGLLLAVATYSTVPPPASVRPPGTAAPTVTSAGPTGGLGVPLPTVPAAPFLPPVPAGTSAQALTVGGIIRHYRVYRPATATRLAPLVVMLHDGFGTAAGAEAAYGWHDVADRQGFVVLYPEGVGGSWDVGDGCCGRAGATGVDDVAFLRAAIADLRSRISVDPTRLYAAGMGQGGMMAYRLACDTSLFAAVGAVGATQLGECPNPAPVSVVAVHGLLDTTVPFDGRDRSSVIAITGPPVADVVASWRSAGRCGGVVERSAGPVSTAVSACPSGRIVELVTLEGVGHEWPGVARTGPMDANPRPAPTATVGALAFDTTAYLWDFFAPRSR